MYVILNFVKIPFLNMSHIETFPACNTYSIINIFYKFNKTENSQQVKPSDIFLLYHF